MPDITRTLTYRHSAFTIPPQQQTLQGLIQAALTANPLAERRERNVGQNVFQFLNTSAMVGGTFCGVLAQYIPGQNQLAFDRVAGANFWAVQEVPPPAPPPPAAGTTAQIRRDYLPFLLYFGIQGNHLVVMQSSGFLAGELAHYFTWLLRERAQPPVPPGQLITLEMASPTRLRAHVGAAKAIRIKKSIADSVPRLPVAGENPDVQHVEKVINEARAEAVTGVLNALNIPIPDTVMEGQLARDLELYIEIRRPHGRDVLGHPIMNQIAQLVAQENDSNYEVVLQNNGVIKGGELKLSKQIVITLPNAGANPAPGPIWRQIDQYLTQLIADRIV